MTYAPVFTPLKALFMLLMEFPSTLRKEKHWPLSVKVVAGNYGKIPAGMPGAGENAWLFVDEISIE